MDTCEPLLWTVTLNLCRLRNLNLSVCTGCAPCCTRSTSLFPDTGVVSTPREFHIQGQGAQAQLREKFIDLSHRMFSISCAFMMKSVDVFVHSKNRVYDVWESTYLVPCWEAGGWHWSCLRITTLPYKCCITAFFKTDACMYVHTQAWSDRCLVSLSQPH